MAWAVLKAREERCDAFVVLGDLFDAVRPPAQVIAAVQEELERAPSPIVLVVSCGTPPVRSPNEREATIFMLILALLR